ncbi:MAG: peptidoglycan -binding protein [Desulfobacteraceae bacterium]|nr:peptidoglycan -binding protein [Desulfobacteraceae bacterium]
MRSFGIKSHQSISVWPGYVDVLSALLMVVIFVVMIFTVVQFLLGEVITGQKDELAELHKRISELTQELGIEKEKGRELSAQVTELSGMIENLQTEREEFVDKVESLSAESEKDKAKIEKQLRLITSLQEDIAALRQVRDRLEKQVGTLSANLEKRNTEVGNLRDRSKKLETRLAELKERTHLAQEKIKEKDIRIQALNALVGEQKEALEKQRKLTADARSEIALLRRRIEGLRSQLEEISQALTAAEKEKSAKEAEIKKLGKRLNIVLAREVNRLNRYRSDFFGRLSKILSDVPYVRIEGDRFVFQAELLFDSGSADLRPDGKKHLEKLAGELKKISEKIPDDIDWVLRIDGHTDKRPIQTKRFKSNWELSTARAVEVVKFLAEQGIPEKRMAAAGFSKFHPLDPVDTPEAYQKNRRIEIKLTAR